MTVEETVEQALSRLAVFGHSWPLARSVLYRRVGVRQQQLFSRAAELNPEYYGVCATATLTQGEADLKDLVAPLFQVERIHRIEIADPGTSEYEEGQKVSVVSLNDPDAAFPPRVTVRNGVIRGVGDDLDGTVSLKVYYSRVPLGIGPADKNREIELPEPYQELLVIDLTRHMVKQVFGADSLVRGEILAVLEGEEKELLAQYDAHVKHFTVPAEAGRFGRTAGATQQ